MTSRRDLGTQAKASAIAAVAVTLTMLSLTPTLSDGRPWLRGALVVIVVVGVVGATTRVLGLPRVLVVLAQTALLLLVITWMFAADAARFWVLPGGAVWEELTRLAQQGIDVMGTEAAPIAVTEGVEFLVVVGVALIALLVDAIAVSWRQATLAGIPLLVLYLVPAVVLPGGVPWPLFLLAGIGWLLLLLADGRRELTTWGRTVRDSSGGRAHSIGGTGRRLGAAALAVAVVVPILLPSLDDGRFGLGTGEGEGEGVGRLLPSEAPITTLNPITNLKKDLVQGSDNPVLRYQTTATQPDYLRVATLTGFDGETWTLDALAADGEQQVADGIPLPLGTSEDLVQTAQTYGIEVVGLKGRRLPVPYPASQVDITGDWRWDPDTLDVFAPTDGDSLNASYTVTHRQIAPSVEQLRAAPAPQTPPSTMTEVPDDTEAALGELSLRVTADATTPYDQALALQNWFRTRFTYSLERVEGNSTTALTDFLASRSGYCEQFAASMALMARVLDIPARVEVGYTPGEQADDGSWEVTAHDAHAWPELWFEGVGWVRFEPTPGGGDGGVTPAYAPTPTDPADGSGKDKNGSFTCRRGGCPDGPGGPQRPLSPDDIRANQAGGLGGLADQGGASGTAPGAPSRWWLVLTLVALGLAAAAAPVVARLVARRRRWSQATPGRAAVEAAWSDVLDATVDVEIPSTATSTPRDVAAKLPKRCRLSSSSATLLNELADLVERTRYSGRAVDVPDSTELRRRAELIRGEIYHSLSPRDRREVAVWPASGRRALADGWNHLGESVTAWAQRVSGAFTQGFRGRRRGAVPSAPRSGS
jgi:transglutaminase-like putative cysteine protease